MRRFALIGAAGYIAPRHLKAIKETGHHLVVAMDLNDSVGIIDRYFPEAEFFTKFEEFSAFIEDQAIQGRKIDYLVVCSPNAQHVPHIKYGLQNGLHVICEKPLALYAQELVRLKEYEERYNRQVSAILQLRLHPAILSLKDKMQRTAPNQPLDVDLTYITSRGKWYLKSWKGTSEKSGGLATNIGVHFFDMLHFIFGSTLKNEVYYHSQVTASGYLEFEHARVRWFLSIDGQHLPKQLQHDEISTYRSIKFGHDELEFSSGYTDLHTLSYRQILKGEHFGIAASQAAIETVEQIRDLEISIPRQPHPLLKALL